MEAYSSIELVMVLFSLSGLADFGLANLLLHICKHIQKGMSMPFQKGHKLGAKRIETEPLDAKVISFRGRLGQKEALAQVPEWQTKLRDYVDQLIAEANSDTD
jgi:hypothetical protein